MILQLQPPGNCMRKTVFKKGLQAFASCANASINLQLEPPGNYMRKTIFKKGLQAFASCANTSINPLSATGITGRN